MSVLKLELLKNLCRLCLQKHFNNSQYTSIYECDRTDAIEIITKIKLLMPTLEFPEIAIDQCVCQSCLILLREFFNFKVACEKNAKTFLEIVKQVHSTIEYPVVGKNSLKRSAPSCSPVLSASESIITPKIVAVYSLQNNDISENSMITDFPDVDIIKIEDDPDSEVEFVPPVESTILKRMLTDNDDAYSKAKLVKSSNTNNSKESSENLFQDTSNANAVNIESSFSLVNQNTSKSTPSEIEQQQIPTQATNTSDFDFPQIFKTEIWNAIDKKLSITPWQIQKIIGEKYRFWPSISQIEKVVKPLHYKITRGPEVIQIRNNRAVIMARLQYANVFSKYNEDKLIFVHEMGIQLAVRKAISLKRVHNKEFRVAAAMSRKELVYFSLSEHDCYNIENYGNWLTDLLPILKWKNKDNSLLVTENCPSYSKENKIISEGHRLVFLPPYSPFLNPLENIFSKWLRDINSLECLTEEALMSYMKQHNKLINVTDCEIVYNKMKSSLSRCIKQVNF